MEPLSEAPARPIMASRSADAPARPTTSDVPRDYRPRNISRRPETPRPRSIFSAASPLVATLAAYLVSQLAPNRELPAARQIYPATLTVFGVLALVAFILQFASVRIRRWLELNGPILAAGVLIVATWDVISRKLALLPLPYFPAPDLVLQSLADDWRVLAESTYRSLLLLVCGYVTGVIVGLVSGVVIGWSARARYWLMPVLKIVGPIPATAFIPLALIVFNTTFAGGVALIALAVWFPVTMLTSSGVSNVRVSYLDVARTLGAGRTYLIFRVALPSALPGIFIGLFMGLGAAFLTLFAAEMLGVKAGLGWYINWKKDWAEYSHVYAALIIIAAVFSMVMTLLFKVRDRLLAWQKGVIRW